MGVLHTRRKLFFHTADANDVLANDAELGQAGAGRYRVWAKSTVVDSTITIHDEKGTILSVAAIPVEAASATYPRFNRAEDLYWEVSYGGPAPNLVIDLIDGTNGEIILMVEKL